jgi:fructose-bisphosphate aldolase class I
MNLRFKSPPARLPWALTFSYGRAIQQPAIGIWRGDPSNVAAAQHALYHRASCDKAALSGSYNAAMEGASELVANGT